AAVAEGDGRGPLFRPLRQQRQLHAAVARLAAVQGLAGAVGDQADDVVLDGHVVDGEVVVEPVGDLAPEADFPADGGDRLEVGGVRHGAAAEQLPGGGGAEGVAVGGVKVVVLVEI